MPRARALSLSERSIFSVLHQSSLTSYITQQRGSRVSRAPNNQDKSSPPILPISELLVSEWQGSNSSSGSRGRKAEPWTLDEEVPVEGERQTILKASYFILFMRYVIATFLSAFFPHYAQEQGISSIVNGLIFAAYPAGIAISSPFAAGIITKMGQRNSITFGLVATSLCTFAFGAVPYVTKTKEFRILGFVLSYFLSGFLGALAETGCIIIVSNRFADQLGTVMATVGTVCGGTNFVLYYFDLLV